MLLRDLLDLWLGQGREIRRLGGNNPPKRLRMMRLQILIQEGDRAALARCMADEDDRFGMDKICGYLLVVGVLLRDMIALVMRFFAVDQMVLESKRIIRLDGDFIFRPATAEIVIDMGCLMVDDHNHSTGLMCFRGSPKDASFF